MASAALLIVGGEMLDPLRPDANGALARERLLGLGLPLKTIVRVEDRPRSIAAALTASLLTSEVVITSGGLGPTGDDVTREGIALALGRDVVPDEGWLAVLEERLAARGRTLTPAGRRQAFVVSGATVIPNPRGLACGSFVEQSGRFVAALPGVPIEFAGMLDEFLLPRLAQLFPERPATRVIRAVISGLPEADVEPVLAPWYGLTGANVSVLPSFGILRVTIGLTAPPADDIEQREEVIRRTLAERLRNHLVSLDGVGIEEDIGRRLLARGWNLAAAESCTGGLCVRKLVAVPGASRWLLGGVTAYSNSAKETLLATPHEDLIRHGAVSEEVARAMAHGARGAFGAACAIATTGVAGPDGGTVEKPVGLVYVAALTPEAETVRRLFFPLDRASVMEIAANRALHELWRLL